MAVSLYFGLPGAGKTTMMVYLALKGIKSQRYRYIYCNVHIAVPGVTYIDNECIGKYDLSDCLILVDEATLFADSRDFKNFGKDKLTYFLEHRHYNADIILFTQQWDGVDRKIRVITDRVFYVYKGKLLGRWFTRCYSFSWELLPGCSSGASTIFVDRVAPKLWKNCVRFFHNFFAALVLVLESAWAGGLPFEKRFFLFFSGTGVTL